MEAKLATQVGQNADSQPVTQSDAITRLEAEIRSQEGLISGYQQENERLVCSPLIWFDLMVLFYMESLHKTRSCFDIKVHQPKKALIKDIGPVNRVHLAVLVSVAS